MADALDEGPAVHGFGVDRRWTLSRISDLIARMFHTRYTLRGTAFLLHRMGWSVQVPTHRAVERDEHAIATWRREVWLSTASTTIARRNRIGEPVPLRVKRSSS